MTKKTRIDTLRSRHRDLDEQIEALHAAPSVDDMKIADLKKKKLALKDEIAALEKSV